MKPYSANSTIWSQSCLAVGSSKLPTDWRCSSRSAVGRDTYRVTRRTVTPRRPGDAGERNVGKFVLRDGELVKVDAAEGKGVRAANGYPASLEEAKAMHHRLLKRQHYGREPPKPTTWDYMGF